MNLRAEALRNIEAARPVTPEALLYRAQTYALLHLTDRIDALIEAVREPCPCAHADAHGLSAIQEAKPPADTSWLKSTE